MQHKFGKRFENTRLVNYHYTPDEHFEMLTINFMSNDVHFLFDRSVNRLYITGYYAGDVTVETDDKTTLADIAKMNEKEFEAFMRIHLRAFNLANPLYVYPYDFVKKQVITWFNKHGVNKNNFKKYQDGYLTRFWKNYDFLVHDIATHVDYREGFKSGANSAIADETAKFDYAMRGIAPNYGFELSRIKPCFSITYRTYHELIRLAQRQLKKHGYHLMTLGGETYGPATGMPTACDGAILGKPAKKPDWKKWC